METAPELLPYNLSVAIGWAADAHMELKDKDGYPAIHHPLYVAYLLRDQPIIYQVVAVLHDIVEDTQIELHYIFEEFGDEVGQAIEAISREDGELYFDYIKRCKKNKIAKVVKLADLGHNIDRCADKPDKYASLHKRYVKSVTMLMEE